MSKMIKSLSLIMLISFIQIHTVMADELKVLTVKEFQEIQNSPKVSQKKLDEFEINNRELVILQRFESSKKIYRKKVSL